MRDSIAARFRIAPLHGLWRGHTYQSSLSIFFSDNLSPFPLFQTVFKPLNAVFFPNDGELKVWCYLPTHTRSPRTTSLRYVGAVRARQTNTTLHIRHITPQTAGKGFGCLARGAAGTDGAAPPPTMKATAGAHPRQTAPGIFRPGCLCAQTAGRTHKEPPGEPSNPQAHNEK